MKYAIGILELELEILENCFSNIDEAKFPDVKKRQEARMKQLKQAIQVIKIKSNWEMAPSDVAVRLAENSSDEEAERVARTWWRKGRNDFLIKAAMLRKMGHSSPVAVTSVISGEVDRELAEEEKGRVEKKN